jgi:hypothetical protein
LAAGAFSAAQSLENDMNVRPIVDCKTSLGEGPVWDVQEQKIYWIDSLGNKVFRANPDGSDASSHLGCGARAHPLGTTTRIPTGDEARVGRLGLLDPSAPLIAMALDIVRVGRASFATRGLVPRFQLQIAQLPRVQRPPGPHVAFAFAQQMPDEHRELTGGRDSGDMLTAAGADSQEERPQGTRRSRCRPSRLDEHAARMPTALLRDPAVIRGPTTRLAHTRVEAR